jgi:glycosyltransferase involved in cell wall biosynthesis
MRIGIDVREMIGRKAGIGYYIYGLLLGLDKIDPENEYFLYADRDFNLSFSRLRFYKRIFKVPSKLWHFAVILDSYASRLDVFHATFSFIIPSLLGPRTVTTIHDASAILFSETHSMKVKTLHRLFFNIAARRTRRVITDSFWSKNDIARLTGINDNKIVVTHLAVDENYQPLGEENIKIVRQKYGLPKDYILYNATLEPRKNVSRLIRAFHQLKKQYTIAHSLVLAGKKGWLYEEFFRLVRNLDLERAIIFTDWVPDEDLPALYSAASVVAYPSLYEGFGLSILKAFACGTPVVTSNVSSMPEVAGDAAILVDPYDTDGLAESLWKVLSDEKLATNLREKGFAQVKKFSWEKTAKETLEVYEEVQDRKPFY